MKTIHVERLPEEIQEDIFYEVQVNLLDSDAIFVKNKSIKYYDKDNLWDKDIQELNERGYLRVIGI